MQQVAIRAATQKCWVTQHRNKVVLGKTKQWWNYDTKTQRIYNNDNEWEERINLFHESQPIRNFRFEIVKENGEQ